MTLLEYSRIRMEEKYTILRETKINIHPDPIKIHIKTEHKKTALKLFKTYPKILQYTAIKTTHGTKTN